MSGRPHTILAETANLRSLLVLQATDLPSRARGNKTRPSAAMTVFEGRAVAAYPLMTS